MVPFSLYNFYKADNDRKEGVVGNYGLGGGYDLKHSILLLLLCY